MYSCVWQEPALLAASFSKTRFAKRGGAARETGGRQQHSRTINAKIRVLLRKGAQQKKDINIHNAPSSSRTFPSAVTAVTAAPAPQTSSRSLHTPLHSQHRLPFWKTISRLEPEISQSDMAMSWTMSHGSSLQFSFDLGPRTEGADSR